LGNITPDPSWSPADYSVNAIDGEGYIDGINVDPVVRGTWTQTTADYNRANRMYAFIGTDVAERPFNTAHWVQIPFVVRAKANDVEYEFSTGGGGGASNLSDLNDVDISDPQDGEALVWNANDEKWKNQTISGNGSGTIWTNNANGCLRAELSDTGFQAFTDATHLDLQDGGIWNVGSYQNNTHIGNDGFANSHDLTLSAGDSLFIVTGIDEGLDTHQWMFSGNVLQADGKSKIDFYRDSSRLGAPEPLGTTDTITLWNFNGENEVGLGYNYAIGVEGDHVWFAQDTDPETRDGGFKFYTRGEQAFKIAANGDLMFKDGTIQTTAYVSGGNANTGNFSFDGDVITNNNYSSIKSETGIDLNVNYDNVLSVTQNYISLQNNNPNFSATYGDVFGSYISSGVSYGFEELLNTNYVGPALVVAALVEHNGQDAEAVGMWTVNGDGNLVTVKAKVWENIGGVGMETSTGDIIDKDGNSLIYVPASDTAPAHNLNGLLWYNSDEGRMYFKYNGAWVDASPTVIPPPIEPTRLLNGDNTVTLGTNGLLDFSTGGAVGNAQQILASGSSEDTRPGIDLYADSTMAWTQLNYNNTNYVWTNERGAYFDVEHARLGLDKDGILKLWNATGTRMIMGEVADGDAVLWVDPSPDTEYLGLWWAGNTDYKQSGYGPAAGINIGLNSWDDSQDEVDPDTQINLGIGSLRWKFAADGGLTIPGNGWASETPDIGTDDSSLFIQARGDSLRTVWMNTAPFETLGSTDAAWLRTELRQEGFNVNIGQKDGNAITPRNWQFRADGALILPNTIGDIIKDGESVLQGNAITMIDGGGADTWLTPDLTASVKEKVKAVPQHSTGSAGDRQGDTAYDDNYMYYCTKDYTTGTDNIWVKNAWTANAW
jgi:hypothetical protein